MGAYAVGNFEQGTHHDAVSRQWVSRAPDEKFTSLGDLHASVKSRRDNASECLAGSGELEVLAPEPATIEDTHKLTIGLPDGREVAPSHWAFGQLASLAKAPAGYLRTIPSQIGADALTYGLKYNRGGDVKLYNSGQSMLAATGPDYGRIYDQEVVEAVMQVAGNGTGDERWKIPGVLDWRSGRYDPDHPITADTTTLFASDRDVFCFLVDDKNPVEVGKLPNGDPDLMFRGFYVSNSEVGRSSLRLAAFYLRAVCANRILWGVEGFEELTMRHSKMAPARFVEQARPALASFAEGSARTLIEGVAKAKAAKIASDDEDMLGFLANRRFSRGKALEILAAVEREEGRPARTIWDAAQGITAVARQTPFTDDRIVLEREAQRILDKVAA